MITIQSQGRQQRVYPEGNRYPNYYEAIYSTMDDKPFTNPVARDLVRIGQAIFTADRAIRRQTYFGGQTRDINVEVPLESPSLFNGAKKELIDFVGFCTRDNWQFEFVSLKSAKTISPKQSYVYSKKFDCVALFSDGLDSLCGAARLIKSNAMPLFVSHFQPRWGHSSATNRLRELASALGKKDLDLDSICLRFELSDMAKEGRHNYFPEYSRRSRPCLYLCYAAAVAAEYGIGKLLLHENGILAMNLPYSRSHFGALISRHAHPVTLFRLQIFLSKIWSNKSNQPIIENPFFLLTKADQVSQFCEQLPRKLVESTISCENASRALLTYKGWLRKHKVGERTDFTQCGVCNPCLIRRQALSSCGFSEKGNYAFGWQGPGKNKKNLPRTFVNDNFQTLKEHCKTLLRKSEIDFMELYFTELSLLAECHYNFESVITDIYKLQKRFARQCLKTVDSL